MKKVVYLAMLMCLVAVSLCGCGKTEKVEEPTTPEITNETSTEESQNEEPMTEEKVAIVNFSATGITAEMALQGIDKYCHSTYDWSIAEENPEMMYVQMGEETETEYKVVFRSYTGAFVNFYVDKTTGTTRIVEKAPNMEEETETGTINLFDYLEN